VARIIVVGAGQAGATLVAKLRSEGFNGDVELIGSEEFPPYERPPLSKAYLLGDVQKERLYLRPEAFYRENEVNLRLGTLVEDLKPSAKEITLSSGEVLSYDAMALATGSQPRRLPASIGGSLNGVLTIRDMKDADAMAPYFQEGSRVLVVGGGYIGLEAAAAASARGLHVTLIEAGSRILQRVASELTSDYFRALHLRHGVNIREGVGLERLSGKDHVAGAVLSDGSWLDINFAIVGIGIEPSVSLATAAGLDVDEGIVTDAQASTSQAGIWAVGDCATCDFKGQRMRIESVGNAIAQSEVAALSMMGQDAEYLPQPWFWSDQFDCKLQIAGVSTGYTDVVVREGEGFRSHWHFAGDELISVDAMNDPKGYMVGKRLIELGRSPSKEYLRDPDSNLKELLRS
jgi:3-phenylpropionate/trans-cinnamate dioxygenase ferredoxin reductase subunit